MTGRWMWTNRLLTDWLTDWLIGLISGGWLTLDPHFISFQQHGQSETLVDILSTRSNFQIQEMRPKYKGMGSFLDTHFFFPTVSSFNTLKQRYGQLSWHSLLLPYSVQLQHSEAKVWAAFLTLTSSSLQRPASTLWSKGMGSFLYTHFFFPTVSSFNTLKQRYGQLSWHSLLLPYSVQLQHSADSDTFSACWVLFLFRCFHSPPSPDMDYAIHGVHVMCDDVDDEVLPYVHRNRRFIRDGSPGRPPRLSHSSWALNVWSFCTCVYTCGARFVISVSRFGPAVRR